MEQTEGNPHLASARITSWKLEFDATCDFMCKNAGIFVRKTSEGKENITFAFHEAPPNVMCRMLAVGAAVALGTERPDVE